MKVTRTATVLSALVFPLGALLVANGCGNKDEDGTTGAAPATTTTTSTTTTTTTTVVLVPEEDAGAADADADAPKVTGSGDATGIRACCSALAQNAGMAPLDQKPMYLQAAAVCQGLVNNPQGRAALVQLRGILRGANMPSACK